MLTGIDKEPVQLILQNFYSGKVIYRLLIDNETENYKCEVFSLQAQGLPHSWDSGLWRQCPVCLFFPGHNIVCCVSRCSGMWPVYLKVISFHCKSLICLHNTQRGMLMHKIRWPLNRSLYSFLGWWKQNRLG